MAITGNFTFKGTAYQALGATLGYIYDSGAAEYRPMTANDLGASVNVSGLSVSVSQVGISGVLPSVKIGVTGTYQTITTNSVSNSATSGNNGVCLPANSSRKSFYIQNMSTGLLWVAFNNGAHSGNFNVILDAAPTMGGAGPSLAMDSYTGVVSVSGLNTQYVSWELTP